MKEPLLEDTPSKLVKIEESADGITRKFHYQVDGAIIQLLLVERPEKNIICFPSQVGCGIRCTFCKSKPFVRNLTAKEMLHTISEVDSYIINEKNTLYSCMGEGEPCANVSELVTVFSELEEHPFASFALSTVGLTRRLFLDMNQFAGRMKIQISHHFVDPTIKAKYMPLAASPTKTLANVSEYYGQKEFNVLFIHDVNDSKTDALSIHQSAFRLAASIKVNKLNAGLLQESDKVQDLVEYMESLGGVPVEYYETNGSDIAGSCGNMTHE